MKKLLSVLLCAVLLLLISPLSSLPVKADNYQTYGALTYTVYDEEPIPSHIIITKCDPSATGKIVIPESIGNVPVTMILYNSFENCTGVTEVVIPASVTSIREKAFIGCTSLTEITLLGDEFINIGSDAFDDTGYYNDPDNWYNGALYVGSHIVKLEEGFSGSLKIKDGTRFFCESAISNNSEVTEIIFPDSVKEISGFNNCTSLETVNFGNGVTKINKYSFNGCTALSDIKIPDSVNIVESSFYNTAYYNNADNWENGVLYVGNHIIDSKETLEGNYVVKAGTKSIAGGSMNTKITGITLPDTLLYIGNSAFAGCPITEITLPDSVVYVGEQAFKYCTSLKKVTLSKNLTEVNNLMFEDCSALESIVIPDGVQTIGMSAFLRCSNLKTVTIPKSVTKINLYAFSGTGIETIYYYGTSNELNEAIPYEIGIDINAVRVVYNYGRTILGDVEGDGLANTTDLALIKKYLADPSNDDFEKIVNGNVDESEDGVINTTDLAVLKKILAGII